MEVHHDEQQTETLILTEDGIQIAAFWTVFLCRNSKDGRFDPLFVMENILPLFDSTFNYRIVKKNEWMWESSKVAFYIPSKNEIIIRSDVYDGALECNTMDVITIAHEVVHYLQHIIMEFLRALDCVDFKTELCSVNSKAMSRHEIQTDMITRLVMCPEHLLKGMTEEEIIRHYILNPIIQVICGIIKEAGENLMESLYEPNLNLIEEKGA